MPRYLVKHYSGCFCEGVFSVRFSSVAQSCLTLQPYELQHARLPCPSPITGACWNSFPLSHWCHPTISSSVVPFSSCLQSFLASGSFIMSQYFSTSDQVAKELELKLQHQSFQWIFRTDLLRIYWLDSLLSKGLSRVFSNITVQKHQFFGTQLSLWSNVHIHTWLLEKPYLWLYGPLLAK